MTRKELISHNNTLRAVKKELRHNLKMLTAYFDSNPGGASDVRITLSQKHYAQQVANFLQIYFKR